MATKNNKRRVSLAPGTKTEDGGSNAKQNQNQLSNNNDINPIKRQGEIKRSQDVRRHRDAYAKIVAEERAEQEIELKELQDSIAYYKKDNEKIVRQQTAKFGITLDEMKFITSDLQHAKSSNDQLYEDLEQRKNECGKLQSELDIVRDRINELASICDDMQHEEKCYKAENERIYILESRIQRLTKANRQMRQLLLQKKVNPDLEIAAMLTPELSRQIQRANMVKTLPPIGGRHAILKHASSTDCLLRIKTHGPPMIKPILKRMKSQPLPRSTKKDKTNPNFTLPRIKPMKVFL